MKKIFFAFLLCVLSFSSFSQIDTTSFYIKKNIDLMTKKESFLASAHLECTTNTQTGFILQPYFEKNKKSKIIYSGIFVVSFNIGNCVEKKNTNFFV